MSYTKIFLIGAFILASSYIFRFGLTQSEHMTMWIISSVLGIGGIMFTYMDRM